MPKKEKDKTKSLYGLKKVPLSVIIECKDKLIKNLRYEIGMLKSERDEWEFKYKNLKADFDIQVENAIKEEKRKLTIEIRREEYTKELKDQIKHLQERLKGYKRTIEELYCRVAKLTTLKED